MYLFSAIVAMSSISILMIHINITISNFVCFIKVLCWNLNLTMCNVLTAWLYVCWGNKISHCSDCVNMETMYRDMTVLSDFSLWSTVFDSICEDMPLIPRKYPQMLPRVATFGFYTSVCVCVLDSVSMWARPLCVFARISETMITFVLFLIRS